MRRRRAEAFLASKTKDRTRDGSWRMLEQSLKLLQTDHLDLWQLHDIGLMEDVDAVFAKGGAMEALRQAHEQKIVRHLGITGHYRPDTLAEGIRRYSFDCILMAMNAADSHHFSFMESLLPLAVEKKMGIIGMKVPGRSRLLSTWTPPSLEAQRHSWEGAVLAPRPGRLDMREAMYFTLSLPVSTVIIGCDSLQQLEQNVQLAREFTSLSSPPMSAAHSESGARREAGALLSICQPGLNETIRVHPRASVARVPGCGFLRAVRFFEQLIARSHGWTRMDTDCGVSPWSETRGKRRSYRSMIIALVRSVQSFMIAIPVKRRRALLASNPIEE